MDIFKGFSIHPRSLLLVVSALLSCISFQVPAIKASYIVH